MITSFLLASAEGVSITAPYYVETLPWLTNSILVSVLVIILILILAKRATRKMQLVPTGGQNMFEAVIENLYESLSEIVGKHMAPKVFPLLATIFLFILASNWFGLLPGVGTIGFGEKSGALSISQGHMHTPLLRPTTGDLNMTLAMALLFMSLWIWWTLSEVGLKNFLLHIFAPKGGLAGFLKLILIPIFFFVGIIEVISILFRPVSLSLRLFGNIYAGESLLHAMSTIGDPLPPPLPYILSVLLPLPFYFLELLVGLIQALVFTLLCSVYIQLSTSHEEEAHEH